MHFSHTYNNICTLISHTNMFNEYPLIYTNLTHYKQRHISGRFKIVFAHVINVHQ